MTRSVALVAKNADYSTFAVLWFRPPTDRLDVEPASVEKPHSPSIHYRGNIGIVTKGFGAVKNALGKHLRQGPG